MKKLLILGGAGSHRFLAETAKDMGIYTIVTDYLEPKYSPAKQIADESWMLDIMETDGIVERCRAENVDAVLNACISPAQWPYQKITERLGLPCYGSNEQFLKMTNKTEFKKFAMECGLDVAPEYTVEECMNGIAAYPVIVKPVDRSASRGQTVCNSPEDVEKAVAAARAASFTDQCLIEKYLENCPLVSVTYFVCGGKPYLIRVADKYTGLREDGLEKADIAAFAPSRFIELFLKKTEALTRELILKLGIKNGPVLIMALKDGDAFRFVDPDLRLPGGGFIKPYCAASGVNLMKILIEFALGQDISGYAQALDGSYRLPGKRIFRVLYNLRPGKVAAVSGIEQLRVNPAIVDIEQRIFVNDTVPATGDIQQKACGILISTDDDPRRIREIIEYIYSTLKYTDENGLDMATSPVDAAKMEEIYMRGE